MVPSSNSFSLKEQVSVSPNFPSLMGSRLRKKLKEVQWGKFRKKNLFGGVENQQRDKKRVAQIWEILGNAETSVAQAHGSALSRRGDREETHMLDGVKYYNSENAEIRISASFLCFYGHWWKTYVQLKGKMTE